DTVDDQHSRNNIGIVKLFLNKIVEQDTDHSGRDRSDQDFDPEPPCHHLLLFRLSRRERIQLMEIDHDYRQDRAQLDHHVEHIKELLALVQLQEFFHQDQMSRTADRKPFCDAFHDSKYDHFQCI